MMMKITGTLLREIEADLALNVSYVPGQTLVIKNCWHFSTDGSSVEMMFYDDTDFKDGMNRIYVVVQSYQVVILAFALMNTHVHFVLYGEYEECKRFIHEYLRRTSAAIERRHHKTKALADIRISPQPIEDDLYLKRAICYDCRNAPVAGLPFTFYDYPWSSAPLYFRHTGSWANQGFINVHDTTENIHELRHTLKTQQVPARRPALFIGDLVFPAAYVAIEIVERIFKTHKAFFHFMCHTKEDDIESRGGYISRLSIPIQEMRQNRNIMCQQMFGTSQIRELDTTKRLRLARALRSKYNCSVKQVARVCGLVASEVEKKL